jgi:hypothetical protein
VARLPFRHFGTPQNTAVLASLVIIALRTGFVKQFSGCHKYYLRGVDLITVATETLDNDA